MSITLLKLQRILTDADPAAVLVSPRVLEGIVQEVNHLHNFLWVVPHRKSAVVDRHILFRHVEQEDLMLQPQQLLPPSVILLARPAAEEMGEEATPQLLLKYWRRLFHANVHLVLEDRWKQGLINEASLQERIEAIGQTEFEEIRAVLHRDNYLCHATVDRAVYVEFAAVYLELRHFAPDLLPVYFPALRDCAAVDELLARELDAQALFQRTRLPGAPDPLQPRPDKDYESHEYYWKLVRNAEHAAATGNRVKAAIVRTRAERVAPAAFSPGVRADAEADLRDLTKRLQPPLGLSDAEEQALFENLKKLLDKADQGQQPVEASILYDLQRVCLDNEREIYALGPVEWVLSFGKRPIRRPLPSQRMVRIIQHLRTVLDRLTSARLTDRDRDQLTELLQGALDHAEEQLRQKFRPVLIAAVEDVGLRPTNPPEGAAFHKMIEEFLDQVIEAGFVTFSDLRDVISGNQMKMPDLTDPQEFVYGDPLLRLDRRLATLLDGVYRPSEIYMRWLEQLTSLNFGTRVGRFLTRYVTAPLGGAFLLLQVFKLLGGELLKLRWGREFKEEDFGPLNLFEPTYWLIVGLTGVFFLLLLHSRRVRAHCHSVCAGTGKLLRRALIDFPVWAVNVPQFQRFLQSWPVQLSYWYILKPGLVCALVFLLFQDTFSNLWYLGGLYAALVLFLTTRTGHALSELLFQVGVKLVNLIRAGLLGSLYSLIVNVFKQITHLVEYVLFKVDEKLLFRSGEGQLTLGVRTVLNILWFPISFVARFYMIVLIEPCINPLKYPISAIAGKILYPLLLVPCIQLVAVLEPHVGSILAWLLVWPTYGLLPDVFGFLVWEIKENWSLYRANRSRALRPVAIGKHGETMRRLLRPGFHSGTIPQLFARLRHAERSAFYTGNWRDARGFRKGMEDEKQAIRRFVTRELISLVHQCQGWRQTPLEVGQILLASNRIEVELRHADYPAHPLRLQWEWRSEWLLASLREPGWLIRLPEEPFWAFLAGLTYLYKRAGVDLAREQVLAALPEGTSFPDLAPFSLVVWLDRRQGRAAVYDARHVNGRLAPTDGNGELVPELPVLEPPLLIFAQLEVTWEQLVLAWQEQGASYRQIARVPLVWPLAQVGGQLVPEPNEPVSKTLRAGLVRASGKSRQEAVIDPDPI